MISSALMYESLPPIQDDNLFQIAYNCLIKNSTEDGFNASGKEEIYGCFFGRDSELSILKILKAHSKRPHLELLQTCRKSLITLIGLQGKEFNLSSGEQPGKFIHEYRKNQFEHLIGLNKPWFVYPDGLLRNYDSIDSTPLGLIAIYKYWQIAQDGEFLITALPSIEAALNWIITFGDQDKDSLIEYSFPKERTHGGLTVQSWTDSHESLRQPDGTMPKYPIAPVEAQAYAWLALKLWSDFYQESSPQFAQKLISQSEKIKHEFNQKFILKDQGLFYAAQALDGDKNQIKTITGNPLICLWASYQTPAKTECIIKQEYISDFVQRGFLSDMFDAEAGIRTMSNLSQTFNPTQSSYHNGSFWTILNGLIHEGLDNFGYQSEAERLKKASLNPIRHFQSAIELYIKTDHGLQEFQLTSGQTGCRSQTWSAAAILDLLS